MQHTHTNTHTNCAFVCRIKGGLKQLLISEVGRRLNWQPRGCRDRFPAFPSASHGLRVFIYEVKGANDILRATFTVTC